MKYLQLFIKLVPFLFQAISSAEVFFADEPKSGKAKKAAVITATKALFDGAVEISTGGQKETLGMLSPLVDKAVDVGVAFAFPK